LVGVGRGADRDGLASPRRPRELLAQDLRHVHLDADRAAVAVVEGPVGAQLERADVTERAAVRAAHVGVQRPGEPHALHAVERAPARLLAVLDPRLQAGKHRTYVRPAQAAAFPILTRRSLWRTTSRLVPAPPSAA